MDNQHIHTNDQQQTSNPDTVSVSPENALEAKVNEYLQGWQRAKADFANYKKDEAARMQELAKYATADLMLEMVRALDSFDLAIAALEKTGAVEKGVYMIRAQIQDALSRRGLLKIEIAAGDPYDPSVAEAIAEGAAEGIASGCVVEVIEPGYRLYEKIIRPARVKIAK